MLSKKAILAMVCSAGLILFSLKAVFYSNHYAIHHLLQVRQTIAETNAEEMQKYLLDLTRFPDRSSLHESGVAASSWLQSQLQDMVKNSRRSDAIVYTIATDAYDGAGRHIVSRQPSVILKIGQSKRPAIILGAHFDTRACRGENGMDDNGCLQDKAGPYPGADDDASGSAVLMEAARTLLNSPLRLNKPVYFIWYAAEEVGRIGSKSVMTDFRLKHIPVDAVMNLDMIGYQTSDKPALSFEKNHADHSLTNFARRLAAVYVKRASNLIQDKAGESDAWTWNSAGYKVVIPFEGECKGEYPHRQHSNRDGMDTLSMAQMTAYLKLALAFSIELAA